VQLPEHLHDMHHRHYGLYPHVMALLPAGSVLPPLLEPTWKRLSPLLQLPHRSWQCASAARPQAPSYPAAADSHLARPTPMLHVTSKSLLHPERRTNRGVTAVPTPFTHDRNAENAHLSDLELHCLGLLL
jgi:hypothetical protein